MLDRCLKNRFTLCRFRAGLAEPFLDGFAAALTAQGYSSSICRRCVCAAAHLGEWAARQEVAIAELDEAVLARFVRHLRRCRCRGWHRGYKRVRYRIPRFLRYLREIGIVASPASGPTQSALATEYGAWMRDQRGLAASTIFHALRVVGALLGALGDDAAGLDAMGVRKFVLEYVRQHAPASAGCVTTAVRCFLRYLAVRGRCSTDLVDAVPKVPTWRLAKLPRYLPDDDVERIIAACDRKSPTPLRDRAMLLLLARLGLRGADVVGLRLGDIEWKQGRVRVAGKARRETRLPLPQEVGDAILKYLETERSDAATDRVFLTASTPLRPITASGLRDVVGRAFERAGVRTPSRGTHILRHSLASRLLREGATLDAIGVVLRHRDVNTTALYAKVDVGLLRQIAQPWPGTEVSPC